VPVVYGLPAPELFEEADRGEVILGGCSIIIGDEPMANRGCTSCGSEWYEPEGDPTEVKQ
jgi:hypothetical protein